MNKATKEFTYLGQKVAINEWDFRGMPVYRLTLNGNAISGRYSCINDAESSIKLWIESELTCNGRFPVRMRKLGENLPRFEEAR